VRKTGLLGLLQYLAESFGEVLRSGSSDGLVDCLSLGTNELDVGDSADAKVGSDVRVFLFVGV